MSADGWVRHGECGRCGECCEVLATPVTVRVALPPGLDAQYLRVREVTRDAQGMAILTGALLHPCPQLERTSPTGCRLYGTGQRPAFCDTFPTRPEEIVSYPGCTYWFQRGHQLWGGQASPFPGYAEIV